MAPFYDALTDVDLERVETILRRNAIEYAVASRSESTVKEIRIAEEDMGAAEEALSRSVKPEHRPAVAT